MAKNKKSEEMTNYERYLANIKQRGISSLPNREETLTEIIAEGDRLLAKEVATPPAATTDAPISTPTKKIAESSNPYLRARLTILGEMDSEKRKLIERLEKEGKQDSYQYEDFVKQIAKLGDKLSS